MTDHRHMDDLAVTAPASPMLADVGVLADEWGLFCAADARHAGVGPARLAGLVGSGAVTSVWRGWYAVGAPESRERLHPLRALSAQRSMRVPTTLSHYSELARLGLPLYRANLDHVHLALTTADGWPRSRGSLRLHPVPAGALTPEGRVPVAMAVAATGLVCGPLDALIAADAALRLELVARGELAEAAELLRGHPGSALLGPFLAIADGRSQSVGETRLRHAFHLMRLPVIPQAKIVGRGFTAYVDLLVEGEMVVAEFDGMVKYGRSHDSVDSWRSGRSELVAEKLREDALRDLGYEVVRVTWSELADPRGIAVRVAAALTRSRARRRRPA